MTAVIEEDELGSIRHYLMDQARLFEDPAAYIAGVEDTLAAVRRLLTGDGYDPSMMVAETHGHARMI